MDLFQSLFLIIRAPSIAVSPATKNRSLINCDPKTLAFCRRIRNRVKRRHHFEESLG
jgi:hypothetical protein